MAVKKLTTCFELEGIQTKFREFAQQTKPLFSTLKERENMLSVYRSWHAGSKCSNQYIRAGCYRWRFSLHVKKEYGQIFYIGEIHRYEVSDGDYHRILKTEECASLGAALYAICEGEAKYVSAHF